MAITSSRVRINAVANRAAGAKPSRPHRGRFRIYGPKLYLRRLLRADLPEYLLRAPHTDLLRQMIVDNIAPHIAPHSLNLDELAA